MSRPRRRDLALRAEALAFVKEGFSWPALFVPAFWLIYHRMWIELVVFLAIFCRAAAVPSASTEQDEDAGRLGRHRPRRAVRLRGQRSQDARRSSGAATGSPAWRSGATATEAELAFFRPGCRSRRKPSAGRPHAPAPATRHDVKAAPPLAAARARRSSGFSRGLDRTCTSPSSITAPAISTPPPRPSSARRARRARSSPSRSRPSPRRCWPPSASCFPASAPSPTASAGLVSIPGMIEALEETVRGRGQALSRHLRRASAHGRARARAWADAGARLDRRRGAGDRARRSRRSRSRIWAGTRSMLARAHALLDGIPTGESGLNAYFVHSYHLVPDRPRDAGGHHRLWRRGHRVRRQGQHGRQPVPPREEPEARARADRQLPCGGSHDPVPRHRPERRAVRAAAPGRDGPGDGVQRPTQRRRRAPSRKPASNGCMWSI